MTRFISLSVLLLTFGLTGCDTQSGSGEQPEQEISSAGLETDSQKLSYGLGMNIGFGMAQQGVPDLDPAALAEGISDAINGVEPRVNQEELQLVITRVREKEVAKMAVLNEENVKQGAIFMAENSKRDGVISTDSGLQYEIISSGEGESPSAESVVKTHYHGTLIDGSVFDSSIDGEPAEFAVNGVIPGWTEALQLMKVGDKWKLFLPAELAYGEQSPGAKIPPNSTLIFEIELLEVVKVDEEAAQIEKPENTDS